MLSVSLTLFVCCLNRRWRRLCPPTRDCAIGDAFGFEEIAFFYSIGRAAAIFHLIQLPAPDAREPQLLTETGITMLPSLGNRFHDEWLATLPCISDTYLAFAIFRPNQPFPPPSIDHPFPSPSITATISVIIRLLTGLYSITSHSPCFASPTLPLPKFIFLQTR